jgi:nicotinamidase-related amidase
VITGVATASGVESTARQAYDLGYNVTLAIDAMTDRRAEAHDYSITRVFPRLGQTGATRDIIALLDRRATDAG